MLLLSAVALLAFVPTAAGSDESGTFQATPGHTGFASGGSLERPPLSQRWSRKLPAGPNYLSRPVELCTGLTG